MTLADALLLLRHVFAGASTPGCADACDADDSGAPLDIEDALSLTHYLFLGGPAPPRPFPFEGEDPTGSDGFDCRVYPEINSFEPGRGPFIGLFLREGDVPRIRRLVEARVEPFRTSFVGLELAARAALERPADPFVAEEVEAIRFGWCEEPDGPDDTLKGLTRKLEADSDRIRSLALHTALTGDERFAAHAAAMLLEWARRATLVNIYALHPDFKNALFDGATRDGYCGERPWNFALDAMWMTYGLINIADAYILLTRASSALSGADAALVEAWLLELTEAVNSSFHSWTRWADRNPRSPGYPRNRADNHLTWCLAGLLAAAVALEDDALARYCLEGGEWTDSWAGPYANPSHIRDLIDRAIEGAGDDDGEAEADVVGRIFEERIERDPPLGYALFHLWPMALVAHIAATHHGDDVWSFRGEDGVGLEDAFRRYSAFALGERRLEREENLSSYLWLWYFAAERWPEEEPFAAVLELNARERFVPQSVGPAPLILGLFQR